MFAALADPAISPKVAPYIDVFHALAPIVYLSNIEVEFFELAKYIDWFLSPAFKELKIWHFELGTCDFDQSLIEHYRKECAAKQCKMLHWSDPVDSTIDYSRYGYLKNSRPAGFSSKSILHFAQLIKLSRQSTIFKKYDYGNAPDNIAKYGQATPPVYDLSLIKSKIFMYLGKVDTLADPIDTSRISSHLKNADVTEYSIADYGHMSFNLAFNSKPLYQMIIAQIDK